MLSGDSVAGENHSELDDSVPSESTVGSSEDAQAEPGLTVRDHSVLPIGNPDLGWVVQAIEEQVSVLAGMDTVALSNADRRGLVTRMEKVQRSLFGMSHTWIADLMDQKGLDDIYGSVPEALSVLMGLSKVRAGQRIRYAEQYGKRSALSGGRLDPILPATASAARKGALDEEHQDITRKFFKRLGSKVDVEARESAEQQLAQLAKDLLPDEFKAAARRLYDSLDPDGDLTAEQVAEQTYVRFGEQDENGLSKVNGRIDAELRAYLDAAFSKYAKPGMCNPADEKPVVDEPDDNPDESCDSEAAASETGESQAGEGSEQDGPTLFDEPDDEPDDESDDPADDESADDESADAADTSGKTQAELDAEARASRDHRGQGRRQHDALKVILRQMLASGKLGQHRGLPVTAVVTMSLKDLEAGSGHAITATGSMVKMRDAIRMASHAHHYLVIFDDDGRPLHLGRSKRLASEDQRIVLMAADRGCTYPGCTRPATWSQVHHLTEWVNGGNTDIESLTFGCDQHHRLVGPGDNQWATTKAGPDHPYPGRTLWHAPATIDPSRKGRINHYHHPNEYIYPAPASAPPT